MTDAGKMERIISGGYCIGCGACKAADPSIRIELDQYGKFQAQETESSGNDSSTALKVCPFSDEGPNEDELGKRLFGDACLHDESLGYYQKLFVGHIQEDQFRAEGASGGLISWVLAELLRRGKIDAVAHVKKVECPDDGVLFRYGISRTEDEIRSGAKSRYYPVEMSGVLEQIRAKPGRYAVVGLPCFIKAIRRLADEDPVIKERVVFCVGLVCGHLKSKAFADYFGWQVGISPGRLEEIDFRVELENRPAWDYGVYLRGEGKEVVKPTSELSGANWGHNFFRYSACDFCDDVFAETADIAIGDAWLPEYVMDSKGNSIVVVRDPIVGQLLERAQEEGRVLLHPEMENRIAESQAGGLRDRREGLAYRLHLKNKNQLWAPRKRVDARPAGITRRRRSIYENRSAIGEASHAAWEESVNQHDIEMLNKQMSPLLETHASLYQKEARSKQRILRFKSRCIKAFKILGLSRLFS